MNNDMKINQLSSTLASLMAQKQAAVDPVIRAAIEMRVKELETEIATLNPIASSAQLLQTQLNEAMACADGSAVVSFYDDSDVDVALRLMCNSVSGIIWQLFSLDARHATLSARSNERPASGWAFAEKSQYATTEDELIRLMSQIDAYVAECARLLAAYPTMLKRAESEGVQLQMGGNSEFPVHDMPTVASVFNRWKASREAKQLQWDAQRRVAKIAAPSAFAMRGA